MTDDWTKEFDERWPNLETWNEHFTKPGNAKLAVKTFIAEQRERARRETVEYIKTHSKRLHMVGGYEVSDKVLEAAPTKE